MRLAEAAQLAGGTLSGADGPCTSVDSDTRTLAAGALFVALRGARYDGHDFLSLASERGAAGALVERGRVPQAPLPRIEVADTRLALGRLGAGWRLRCAHPVIGLTGSNGKTTVKEMLAAILRAEAALHGLPASAVLATRGNRNNDIGVPLTLLELRPPQHRYAVVEMGMNHAGEIARLTRMVRPDVALITNAGSAHIENLGSRDAIAAAKGEIFEGLGACGSAVLNADDPYLGTWRRLLGGRPLSLFGLDAAADVTASVDAEPDGSRLRLRTPRGEVECRLRVPGLHNVHNALAAAAAALAVGAGTAALATGLGGYTGIPGRLQRRAGLGGALLIDDSYNANPDSARAAIAVLAAQPGHRILVLGDMAELGEGAPALHAEIGACARAAGVDALYTLGPLAAAAAAGFGPGARHCATLDELVASVAPRLDSSCTVLVKGSRSSRMERAADAFADPQEAGRHAA
jgi:UDP-N-acetylmuramoyl-tripeptide--D-alanyl-D-alanine ligase